MLFSSRKTILIVFAVAISILLLVLAGRWCLGPLYFSYTIHGLNMAKEKQLLYQIDHEELASELRDFANANGWRGRHKSFDFEYYLKGDPEVPEPLRALNPSVIRIFKDRIEFECGGAFLSFGISVFRDGISGYGTKKLAEGVWFYAEDGRAPKT